MSVRRLLRWPVRLALLAGGGAGLRRLLAARRSGELRPSPEPWAPLTTPPPATEPRPATSPIAASDATGEAGAERPGPGAGASVGAAVATIVEGDADLADAAAADGPVEDAAVPTGTETARVVGGQAPDAGGPAAGHEGPGTIATIATSTASSPTASASPAAASGSTATATADEPAWVQPVATTCPTTHPVKANESSGIYHLPGGLSYDRVVPERCYRTPADAESDGFRAAKR